MVFGRCGIQQFRDTNERDSPPPNELPRAHNYPLVNASVTWRESQAAVGCSVTVCAHDLPVIVDQNDHDVEQPKRCGRHDKHIDRSDAFGLIAQEAAPSWGRRTSSSHHVLRDGGLADFDAELEQLAVDPGCTPQRVGAAHLPNQVTNLAVH
jgi:hypothetical protein